MTRQDILDHLRTEAPTLRLRFSLKHLRRLPEIEGQAKRIPDVTARQRRIFLDDRAAGGQQSALRRFDVGCFASSYLSFLAA